MHLKELCESGKTQTRSENINNSDANFKSDDKHIRSWALATVTGPPTCCCLIYLNLSRFDFFLIYVAKCQKKCETLRMIKFDQISHNGHENLKVFFFAKRGRRINRLYGN